MSLEKPSTGLLLLFFHLQTHSKPRSQLRFVTNTTKESSAHLLSKLSAIGFDIDPKEVFTSLIAARRLVESLGVRPLLFLEDQALEEFEGIETKDPNAVVVGLSPKNFHYDKLTEAMRIIQSGGPLIAIHKARYFARPDGLALGPGAFVAALEYATDVKSQIVGKPEPSFFRIALDDLGVTPDQAIMIGDDVRDDVGGAMALGMQGYLVKTGKYRDGDETSKGFTPSKVYATFAEAVDAILQNQDK
ncbi:Haloacid dehalogenase-like hydrolase domain-containing protein 2 [Borealophlyctis nickersoniae]|nr:Haloacid dehalogenase-like hydrolase domain-containing protein 2 [Borealophlyctis nickersoniae]